LYGHNVQNIIENKFKYAKMEKNCMIFVPGLAKSGKLWIITLIICIRIKQQVAGGNCTKTKFMTITKYYWDDQAKYINRRWESRMHGTGEYTESFGQKP
jgi:hypothetical protein